MENLSYETLNELSEMICEKLDSGENYEFDYNNIICDRVFENYQINLQTKIYTKKEYDIEEELELTIHIHDNDFSVTLANSFNAEIDLKEVKKFELYDKNGSYNNEYISTQISNYVNYIMPDIIENIIDVMNDLQDKIDLENEDERSCLNHWYYTNC